MNKEQYLEWIKTAQRIDESPTEYDPSGNQWYYLIYMKDGKYYMIEVFNNHFYEPQLVERHSEMVEQITWIPISSAEGAR